MIKFNVIERGQPGVIGGGEKKFYASTKTSGDLTLDDLTTSIEKISTVSGADIRAVLYAMVDAMKMSLANGNIVRLGELGSLQVTIRSNGEEKLEDVNAATVNKARVTFKPGSQIRDMLQGLKYVKAWSIQKLPSEAAVTQGFQAAFWLKENNESTPPKK